MYCVWKSDVEDGLSLPTSCPTTLCPVELLPCSIAWCFNCGLPSRLANQYSVRTLTAYLRHCILTILLETVVDAQGPLHQYDPKMIEEAEKYSLGLKM
jgi:hypothetical protein